MSSRAKILSNIKQNKPEILELPSIDTTVFFEDTNLIETFKTQVETVGGQVLRVSTEQEVLPELQALFPSAKLNFSTIKAFEAINSIALENIRNPRELEDLDILILEGVLGVAENGAVWINDTQLPFRVLPFITKHLVLVVNQATLVPYMHQAYEKLEQDHFDFGVFLSGPSKTADIEQSLVIGAQGALSLTVILIEE